MADEKKSLITPLVRFSYPTLFQPRLNTSKNKKPDDKPRYSIVGLVLPFDKMPADDQARLRAILQACLDCGYEKFGKEKVDLLRGDGKFKIGFREDIRSKGYPEEFKWFIQPWSNNRPGVVSNFRGPDGKPIPITDASAVYAGCWGRLSVRPFTYDTDGNKGVSLGLSNVQKIRDDKRLDNKVAAEDEFEATEEGGAEALAAISGSGGSQTSAGSSGTPQGSKDDLTALLGG